MLATSESIGIDTSQAPLQRQPRTDMEPAQNRHGTNPEPTREPTPTLNNGDTVEKIAVRDKENLFVDVPVVKVSVNVSGDTYPF